MSARRTRHVSICLLLAASFAATQSVRAQRAPALPAPDALSASPKRADATQVVPFRIQVPSSVLTDVKQRVSRVRFADQFPDADWDYGTNLAYLRSVVDY